LPFANSISPFAICHVAIAFLVTNVQSRRSEGATWEWRMDHWPNGQMAKMEVANGQMANGQMANG
jgi:hypothetical protein